MPPPPMYFNAPPPPIVGNVPMNPDTTGYFGNLSPGVSEDVITAILVCCGGFKRLKRPSDPSSGKPKPFALVEFGSVGDLTRAFRLLQDFMLDNRHLSIKIESSSPSSVSGVCDFEGDLKCLEGINRVLIGKRVTGGGSLEWIEKKISSIREESLTSSDKDSHMKASSVQRDRQRNYSDLIFDTKTRVEEGVESASRSEMESLQALKDRERRWELKVRDLERDLRRELEKDSERERRHEREALALSNEIRAYSDAQFVPVWGSLSSEANNFHHCQVPVDSSFSTFFTSRDKWRRMREKASEREAEIFGDCLKILESTAKANLVSQQREILLHRIPVDKEELFAYPVEWSFVDSDNFREICRERTAAFFSSSGSSQHCDRVSDIIYDRIINSHISCSDLIKELKYEPSFLVVSNESNEADVLVMLLWRWLIFLALSNKSIKTK